MSRGRDGDSDRQSGYRSEARLGEGAFRMAEVDGAAGRAEVDPGPSLRSAVRQRDGLARGRLDVGAPPGPPAPNPSTPATDGRGCPRQRSVCRGTPPAPPRGCPPGLPRRRPPAPGGRPPRPRRSATATTSPIRRPAPPAAGVHSQGATLPHAPAAPVCRGSSRTASGLSAAGATSRRPRRRGRRHQGSSSR